MDWDFKCKILGVNKRKIWRRNILSGISIGLGIKI